MKIFEIGTGYTSIPAQMGAATEIVVEELTNAMLKEKMDVTIIDIKDKNRKPCDLPIKSCYIPQFFNSTNTALGIFHKLKRVLYSISLSATLHILIRRSKEKIVLHFHNQYNLFFFLKLTPQSLRNRIEINYTTHSYIWNGEWQNIKNTISKRYFQEVTCVREADRVFVLNEKTIEHFTKHLHIDRKKIQLIKNGVNIETYHPFTKEDKKSIKTQWFDNDAIVIFQAGSICERKNQLGSLELLLPLMEKNKKIIFIYAGGIIDPLYQQKIEDFAIVHKLQKQVYYFGEVKPGHDLQQLYGISDAFIFPSTSEGFSLVILEAMAAGLPVFVNKKSNLKLPNDGKEGCLLFDGVTDFEEKFKSFILNTKRKEEQAFIARNLIEKEYSWNKVALSYLHFFTQEAF